MKPIHALFLAFLGCDSPVTRTLHRDNCLTCHTPLEAPTIPSQTHTSGIEDAHPAYPLTCTDCHGGAARICDGTLSGPPDSPSCDGTWRYEEALAHVPPGDSPTDLSGLVAPDLDDVDRAYLRFINPTDLRVVTETCGRCHTDETAAVRRSGHALQTGDLAIARFRSGLQPSVAPRFGAAPETDPRPQPDACTSVAVTRHAPLPIDVTSTEPRTRPSPENVIDQLLVQQCLGCHLQDSGPLTQETRSPGTHRGSGCAACHYARAEDGLSRSGDPWVSESEPGHLATHALISRPPTETCVTCHHEGARIGLNYQGLREAPPGTAPPHAVAYDRELYGLAPGTLLRDEDGRNGYDETPPDLHFEAGMDCIDCHGAWEVHGDGHLGADRTCQSGITRCEDCHGDLEREADPRLARHALSRNADGAITLTLRRSGKVLEVPQVKRTATSPTSGNPTPSDAASKAHGILAHMNTLECSTCHSGWVPSCYGCHIDHDLGETGRYLTTAALVPGRATTRTLYSSAADLVLMWNSRGKLQPSMPSERIFVTLTSGDNAKIFENAPRSLPGPSTSGRIPSFGQRAIDPHTTRRKSQFSDCDRCHMRADESNLPTLDLTHGFGTDRMLYDACDISENATCPPGAPTMTFALDATLARDGTPLVIPGHGSSRPLTLSEIDAMRSVIVGE